MCYSRISRALENNEIRRDEISFAERCSVGFGRIRLDLFQLQQAVLERRTSMRRMKKLHLLLCGLEIL